MPGDATDVAGCCTSLRYEPGQPLPSPDLDAPTAAWDEGNMIQAMARMKNPTIAWRFGDG